MISTEQKIDNIKNQFYGFYETKPLFDELKGLKQFRFERLDKNDFQTEDISIIQKLPLGKRIEFFFEHYIKLSPSYKLIYKNIQIIENKNTLGEIDFILFDKKENSYKHIELVYKYYLYDPTFKNELDRYVGPNRDDTLIKKVNKIIDKQFPLLFKNSTKQYLPNLDFENLSQEVCFKANIYIPFYKRDLKILFEKNIRGFYVNFNDFKNDSYFKECKYIMPHRYDWVDFTTSKDDFFNFDNIKEDVQFFINNKKSPLLLIKEKDKISQIFITYW